MDKVLLSAQLFMAGEIFVAIACFVILAKINKTTAKEKGQDKLSKETKGPQIVKLETQIHSLEEELKKARASYAGVQNEIQESNKKKSDLNEELLKYKRLHIAGDIQLDRLKKENAELKDKSAKKEKELENKVSWDVAAEKELQKKNDDFQVLEKENKEKSMKLRDLEARIEALNKQIEAQSKITYEYKKKIQEEKVIAAPPKELKVNRDKVAREQKKEKIGDILLECNFITKEILDKALKYQEETGGSVTQYLLAYGYIDEGELAQCLCTQFGIPYLPLNSYKIPQDIIKLVPVDIAEKYWLIPVEKIGNLLMVVMADPFDAKAIKEIEEITGCGVQPFVGILSEIIESLEAYYKLVIKTKDLKSERTAPFFIDTTTYKGPDRRESARINTEIDVSFPAQGQYVRSKIKDVSRIGFLLESEKTLSIGTLVALQIDLPKEVSPLPMAVIVQVIRVNALENNRFGIGVKIIKISKQELDTIIEYASAHQKT